ncbi:nifR3 family TIM-barrel protein [Pseudonocardia eucalypti]|uniref:tRNA dihydrouridine synthase DusB n=1 Tax=Pseudonocardia eucalypti TaxID=648755 RepID=UPI0018126A47|nr:nifR3 family TIM-barrel protein [Pseudonocardia eucalypti]
MSAPTIPTPSPAGTTGPGGKGELRIGPFRVDPPVVLAPMAGITNVAFRRLCREHGAGLYVCEMITSRALVERHPETFRMIRFAPEERPRSLQLYGVDPATVGAAVRMVVEEDLADHVDLNFGCPVPKVTRRGGGAALPYKHRLFDRIVSSAVHAAAGRVPVTVKMRVGIDEEHHTFLRAGRIAADAGVAAVALHARTAAQRYSGEADWSAIAALRDAMPAELPVLGNGDIFSAGDALRMMAGTGCDGVVVGRGCLGRPWLFGELEAAFRGRPLPPTPRLGQVAATLLRHARLLTEHHGEQKAIRDLRKHTAWYLKGFPVGSAQRRRLSMVSTLAELEELLGQLDAAALPTDADAPRGRQGSPARVTLPEGWLDDPEDATVPGGAELPDSGG